MYRLGSIVITVDNDIEVITGLGYNCNKLFPRLAWSTVIIYKCHIAIGSKRPHRLFGFLSCIFRFFCYFIPTAKLMINLAKLAVGIDTIICTFGFTGTFISPSKSYDWSRAKYKSRNNRHGRNHSPIYFVFNFLHRRNPPFRHHCQFHGRYLQP